MSRTALRAGLLVAILAVGSRVALLLWMPMPPLAEVAVSGDGDTRYYVRNARHLRSTWEYAQGNLRAYVPPGYAFFLSRLLWLGADSGAIQIVQNLLYLVAVAILAALAAHRQGWRGGALVGVLALASPSWLLLPQTAMSETLFVALMATAILIALAGPTPPGPGRVLVAGLVLGLAALVREMGLVLAGLMALVVGIWVWRAGHRPRGMALAGTMLLGATLVILPWSVRNYSIFGQVVPIALNGPINLYIGNNPEATGVFLWRLPSEARAVWDRPDQGRSNELFVSQVAGREAVAFMRAHPWQTVALVPRRQWALWGPPVALHAGVGVGALVRLGLAVWWFACLALGILGLWQMRRDPLAWFIAGACLTATVIHAVTFGDVRFRAPQEYLLMLPAGLAGAKLWAERAGRRTSGHP
jgi:hypothetical protein